MLSLLWQHILFIKSKGGEFLKMSGKDKSSEGKEEKNTKIKFKPVYIIIAVLVISLVVALIYILQTRKEEGSNSPPRGTVQNGSGMVLNPGNLSDEDTMLADPGVFSRDRVIMSSEWIFENGQSNSSTAMVRNHPTNPSTVYFEVFLDDTDEMVFSSPYIPLGEELSGFSLDVNLRAGTYNATVVYYLVDDNNVVVTDTTFSGLTITILN